MYIPRLRSPSTRSALLVLLVLALAEVCSARDKKDVIQFTNGDRITCEIVKLDKGYLYVKLDYADGTVAMDWSKIVRVESPQSFLVSDKTGMRYTGSLQSGTEGKTPGELNIQVKSSSMLQTVPGREVVEIGQTETSSWQNLHGGLDVGFNYDKVQNRTQYNFDTNVLYTQTKWSAAADYGSSFSGGGGISNLRNDLRLTGQRQMRSPHYFYAGLADFLHSDEQQLDLRTTVGGALGHIFRNTNSSFIAAYGGVVWNRERYSALATVGRTGDSAEAILGTQMSVFRFKTTNIVADARFYPSLTDPGRTRFDLNTSLKLRVAKNLFWSFGYYLNFDSRPPQNLPKTDYGSTSGLGWKF